MRKFSGSIARRYSTALYESILESSKKSSVFSFEQKVEIIRALYSVFDKSVTSFFASPILTKKEKSDLIKEILSKVFSDKLQVPSEIKDFFNLIIENDRFEELSLTLKYFLTKVDEHLGILRATLISANYLSQAIIDGFSSTLETALKKKIILEIQTDKSLRAGFIVKIGNTKIDVSLRSHLANLKESLNY